MPVVSMCIVIGWLGLIYLNYIDPFKCLQLGIGLCLLSQPGLYRNDPLKYFLLILLLAGDVAENPGPEIEHNVKNLSICHINAQSMLHKLDLIAVELSAYDIITVSETWLDASVSTTDLLLPSYQPPIRLDRNRHGGGVAIYLKKCIPFFERTDLIIPNLEAIWLEINLCNKKVILGNFYIHPRFTQWNIVEVAIEQATQACSNLILIGDFNQDMLLERKSHNIRNIMNIFGLNQIINSPTRVTPNTSTLIDLILVSDSLHCTDKGTIPPFCSDHHAVYFKTNFLTTKTYCYSRKVWQYENADFNLYRQKLRDSDWNIHDKSIDEQLNCIITNIAQSAEQTIPNKNVKIKPMDLPWFHNDIRKNIRVRNRLHTKAKRDNTPEAWRRFREARNNVVSLIRNAKVNYFKKLATNLHQGNLTSRQWWKVAKQFLKSNGDSEIPILIENNTQFKTPAEKASLLNSYFCDQSNVDDSHASLPPFEPPDIALNNITVTDTDVEDVLKLLNVNKACGPDLISPKLLKEGTEILTSHLSRIFNLSLFSSYFPPVWKQANVVPVFKKGDKTNVSNYRPISLLSCVGKVFEKCVFKHLHNFIVTNRLISPVQSGFTPNDSAVFQLLDLYDTFTKAIDDGKEIRVIFCDISKAFDRVWHKGLLFKLRRMGVGGSLLEWFRSYLGQRQQRVVLEGSYSDYIYIKAGVPQGSILGPLLFLIFINDIVNDIGSNIKLFADDTSLYIIVEDPVMAANLMDIDLDRIHSWADSWLVNFNPHKTEELIISRKTTVTNHPPVTMNNVVVKRVDSHKHLGVIFSNDCTWHEHINEITSKAWKRINILQSLKFLLDRKSLEIMYFSFVRPLLEYADIIWDNCYNFEKESIEKVQYEAGRIVTGATKSCSRAKILQETGWDTLEKRRYKHRMTTFYKMVKNIAPQYLQNLVPPSVHQVSQRNLRNNANLTVPRSRTNLYDKSFIPLASREWNSLPDDMKSAPSLNSFKFLLDRDKVKVPKYYYTGERKPQILHSRLRLGCSSLNADLFNNHIIDNDKCSCGSAETADHYLLHCTNYTIQRRDTINTLNVAFNTEILLKGCPMYSDQINGEIFNKVHKFIVDSKRF